MSARSGTFEYQAGWGMDAANPRYCWTTAGLLAVLAAGCSTPQKFVRNDSDNTAPTMAASEPATAIAGRKPYHMISIGNEGSGSLVRAQAPSPPVAGYPVAPTAPVAVVPETPVAAVSASSLPIPSPPGDGTATATPASFTMPPNSAALRQFVLTDKPRVKVVAVIGKGNIVTDEEVWAAVRQRRDHQSAVTAVDRDVREAEMYRYELKRIIERELLVDDMLVKMKKNKPGALEEIKEYAQKTADRNIRETRRRNGFATDKEFEDKALAPQGLSLNVMRRQLERGTIMMEYIRSIVREKAKGIGLGDVREYYVKNPDKFATPDRVKWQDIFIATAKFATPQEAYLHAEEIRRQAVAGADFAALSKQHDHGDAGFRNGDGVGQVRGEIRPVELETVIFQTEPGQVSPLVQVEVGYHIVKVVERQKAGVRPFDEKCQESIRDMLFEQMQKLEYERLTENLWRTGAVQVVDVP